MIRNGAGAGKCAILPPNNGLDLEAFEMISDLKPIVVSEEQFDFFVAIYNEVFRKEVTLGKFKGKKTIHWLIEKLKEERAEVDVELDNLNSPGIIQATQKLTEEELLHEAILCLKIRSKLKAGDL
jgi:hypothetical protein